MRRRRLILALLVCLSACTAERIEERIRHGDFTAIRYSWYTDVISSCPRYHNETRLYGPGGERLACHVHTLTDSSDGEWTVGHSGDSEGGLFVLDHRKTRFLRVQGDGGTLLRATWSPGGLRALLSTINFEANASCLEVLDVESGEPRLNRLLRNSPRSLVERESWSPDQRSVAFIEFGREGLPAVLVQYAVVPSPAEVARTEIKPIDGSVWAAYQIQWTDGRAQAIPR